MISDYLDELHNTISNNIRHINRGGCGIAAYILCKLLRNKGYPVIIMFDDREDNFYYIEKYSDNSRRPKDKICHIVPWHFFLCIGDTSFDAEKYIRYKLDNVCTIPNLRVAISKGRWNDTYSKTDNKLLYTLIKSWVDKLPQNIQNE